MPAFLITFFNWLMPFLLPFITKELGKLASDRIQAAKDKKEYEVKLAAAQVVYDKAQTPEAKDEAFANLIAAARKH